MKDRLQTPPMQNPTSTHLGEDADHVRRTRAMPQQLPVGTGGVGLEPLCKEVERKYNNQENRNRISGKEYQASHHATYAPIPYSLILMRTRMLTVTFFPFARNRKHILHFQRVLNKVNQTTNHKHKPLNQINPNQVKPSQPYTKPALLSQPYTKPALHWSELARACSAHNLQPF